MLDETKYKQTIDNVKSMTELELEDFLTQLSEHLTKQNMNHLAGQCFGFTSYEEDYVKLQEEFDELSDERDELRGDLDIIKVICANADEDDFEKLIESFDSLKKML